MATHRSVRRATRTRVVSLIVHGKGRCLAARPCMGGAAGRARRRPEEARSRDRDESVAPLPPVSGVGAIESAWRARTACCTYVPLCLSRARCLPSRSPLARKWADLFAVQSAATGGDVWAGHHVPWEALGLVGGHDRRRLDDSHCADRRLRLGRRLCTPGLVAADASGEGLAGVCACGGSGRGGVEVVVWR